MTARAILLRAVLGTLLGLLPATLFILLQDVRQGEWHFFVAMGLFLGGLGGLGSIAERLALERRWPVQLAVALGVTVVAALWGLAAIFQAEWTRVLVQQGSDAAQQRLTEFFAEFLHAPEFVVVVLLPLGAVIGATTLARARGWPWWTQVAVALPPLLVGLRIEEKFARILFVFGGALVVTHLGAAWLAEAVARRLWADRAPRGPEAWPRATAPDEGR